MTRRPKGAASAPVRPFSVDQMFRELADGPPRVLTGFVRKSPNGPAAISFAKATVGSRWVDVPEGVVTGYEHLGEAIRDDALLPIVNLYLRAPENEFESTFLHADAGASAQLSMQDAPQVGPDGTYANSKGPCIPLGNGKWWCP